jgi:redox-sensitive bicupin YhaK (pirin superfamily)
MNAARLLLQERPMIELVIPARRKDLGDGFEVGRVLPFAKRRMVGPFIFLDHMGPVTFKPGQGITVRPHPHIGLSTVTYLFSGEIMHRDSLGFTQAIRPGEVNWMTAGRGIVHSERSAPEVQAQGGIVHGLQTWVALPDAHEETAPAFVHYDAAVLPRFENAGARGVVIAGTAYGLTSSVATHSPLFYVDVELDAGARVAVPTGYDERAAYIVHGRVESGDDVYDAGNLLVFGAGDAAITAVEGPARVMLLGGAPLGPRHIWWNFVSSSEARIEQAKADWKEGRMTLPPDDNGEFIPLPI